MTSPSLRKATLWTLCISILLNVVKAAPILVDRAVNPQSGPFNITVQGIVLGVIAIISGLYFLFFGYRFFKLTMFIVGLWFFGNVVYIAMANAGADQTLTLIIAIIVGVLGGALLACCWHLGLYFLAGLFGYALALWILEFRAGGVIQDHVWRSVFIAILVIVCVILMIFFEFPLVVIATSFLGAFLIMFGIDMFVGVGFASTTESFLNGNVSAYDSVSTLQYVFLAATFVLAVIGVLVQLRFHGRRNFRNGAVAPIGYGSYYGRRGNATVTSKPVTTRRRWWF